MTTMKRFGMLVALVVLAACGPQEAQLQQLQISPLVTEVTENLQANVVATAVYSDGSTKDVTAEVAWSTVDAAVASAGAGVVQAAAPGSTYLTAAYAGLETSARVDVIAATLLSLRIDTDAASLPVGLTARATASGTFSDGSTRDVTAAVVWSASSAVVEFQAGGQVRAVRAGVVELRGTIGATAAVAPFEVTDAAPVSITVQGVGAELALGVDMPIQVMAHYTDGSLRNVTADASVQVLDQGAALLDALEGLAGLQYLRGLRSGASEVRATFAGLSAAARFQVVAAAVDHLTIRASSDAVKAGDQFSFTVIATLTDGTTADLTSQVAWTSADPLRVLVSTILVPGGALALSAGTATITAFDPASQMAAYFTVTVSE